MTPASRRGASIRSASPGRHCGELGKQDNCQVAVSLSVANDQASLPIAFRLHLPEAWAEDPERRAKAGVPEEVGFLHALPRLKCSRFGGCCLS